MTEIAVIGLDLAKTVFQIHSVSADGDGVVRRQLRRSQVIAFFEKLVQDDELAELQRGAEAPRLANWIDPAMRWEGASAGALMI